VTATRTFPVEYTRHTPLPCANQVVGARRQVNMSYTVSGALYTNEYTLTGTLLAAALLWACARRAMRRTVGSVAKILLVEVMNVPPHTTTHQASHVSAGIKPNGVARVKVLERAFAPSTPRTTAVL
jgi:hypothetical protein